MARVFIVDDDVEYATDMAHLLTAAGHHVDLQHTTVGVLDVLRRQLPDVVILDVMFPDNPMGGPQLARDIRRERQPDLRTIPIIMLTGVNQELGTDLSPERIDPNWLPVQAFLDKPADPVKLLEKVRELAATRGRL